MLAALDWAAERSDWPNAEFSSFHEVDGLRWHVQRMGSGPVLLLIHGTGASTHSWRALAPLLAERYTVVAADLPGHGFTSQPPRPGLSLPAMAASLGALLNRLELQPSLVAGHSAGVAILIRCCLDGLIKPQRLISINGALLPFRGHAGFFFPSLAKLLFLNPLTPRMLARSAADPQRVVRLIRGTGSDLDAAGIEFYRRLFSSPAHVAATLGMMANWDLHRFVRDLPALRVPLLMIAGDEDKAVPPSDAERVCAMLPGAELIRLPKLGHLAHEEDPQQLAGLILQRGLVAAADL